MRENFINTAKSILRFQTSRDPLVQKMVITLIPTLAVYDTQTFSEHFLHKAMGHLLTLLSNSHERSFGVSDLPAHYPHSDFERIFEAFIAIGHTAKAVGSGITPFINSIMNVIKIGLQNRG
jgi:FKBP12-rapamycin complex-associated protein